MKVLPKTEKRRMTMKKLIARIISMLLCACMLVSLVPVNAHAASETIYVEVTKDNAPLRAENNQDGAVVARYEKGIILETEGSCINKKLNTWYKVDYEGKTCYIYSGNVAVHEHKYMEINVLDYCFYFCDCGELLQETTKNLKLLRSPASVGYIGMGVQLVTAYSGTISMEEAVAVAGGLSIADGALPVGDVIALGVLLLATLAELSNGLPDQLTSTQVLQQVDYRELLKRNEESCSDYSYRRVTSLTKDGNLTVSKTCYNLAAAFVCAAGLKENIYTRYVESAYALAALFSTYGSYKTDPAHNEGYYQHFHLYWDEKNSGKVSNHVFYGTALSTGALPIGY